MTSGGCKVDVKQVHYIIFSSFLPLVRTPDGSRVETTRLDQ